MINARRFLAAVSVVTVLVGLGAARKVSAYFVATWYPPVEITAVRNCNGRPEWVQVTNFSGSTKGPFSVSRACYGYQLVYTGTEYRSISSLAPGASTWVPFYWSCYRDSLTVDPYNQVGSRYTTSSQYFGCPLPGY